MWAGIFTVWASGRDFVVLFACARARESVWVFVHVHACVCVIVCVRACSANFDNIRTRCVGPNMKMRTVTSRFRRRGTFMVENEQAVNVTPPLAAPEVLMISFIQEKKN